MSDTVSLVNVTVPTGGGTYTIGVADIYNPYMFAGTGTLSSSYSIVPDTTPSVPTLINILYFGDLDLNGNTFTIFGYPLTASQVSTGFIYAQCVYDLTAWRVVVTTGTQALPNDVIGVEYRSLGTGGGTITLVPGVDKRVQYLTGSGTLTSSWTVQGGGSPVDDNRFIVIYAGSFSPNGNSMTVFGNAFLSGYLSANKPITVFAFYEETNSVWRTQMVVDPSLAAAGERETFCVTIKFTEGSPVQLPIPIWYTDGCEFMGAQRMTIEPFTTDNASVIFGNSGFAFTGGLDTIAAGTAINVGGGVAPTGNTHINRGQYLSIYYDKATPDGAAFYAIDLKRT